MTIPFWHEGYKLSVKCQNCLVIHGRIWIYMYLDLDYTELFRFICHLTFNESSYCSRDCHIRLNIAVLICQGIEWVLITPWLGIVMEKTILMNMEVFPILIFNSLHLTLEIPKLHWDNLSCPLVVPEIVLNWPCVSKMTFFEKFLLEKILLRIIKRILNFGVSSDFTVLKTAEHVI